MGCIQLVIPVWFNPPVFEGMAPAKPKAASPASGFLASPVICERFVKGEKKIEMKNSEVEELNHHQAACRPLNDFNEILKNSIWS